MSTFHAYVDAAHFHEALGNVLRFAAKRSRLPILEEAQVRFEDGHCVLTCTNLDQWCMSTIPAVGDSFSFVFVGTRKILSACKYFSGELELTYTIEPTETNPDPRGQISISDGKRSLKRSTERTSDFPELKEKPLDRHYPVNPKRLLERFKRVKYAVSSNDARPNQCCIEFLKDKIIAVDGYRLAMSTDPAVNVEKPFYIPPEVMAELTMFKDQDCTISVGEEWAAVESETLRVLTRIPGYDGFDVERAIPTSFSTEYPVDVDQLLDEVRYAKMEGVSNRQAFRALSEDSVLYRFPQQPLSQKPAEREPSSLAVRHNVYYDMLMHLELSPKHKADLLARGLSEERIEQNMYRTLPMSSSARRFLAGILSDFHNLEGVPGFYVDRGYWNILGHSGLLVPCRDRNGYIQGLQIRLDDETKPDRKYRWLSSRGKAHGTRSYSYIHVTGNIHARTAYLTEGGLKGDVASFLDHDALFLCFAGVTAIAGLKDALQSMENLEEVVVALDMDKLVNWRVRNALGKILETVQSIPNLRVRLMNWNMTFKGVDDFYKARNEAASKGVNILDMTSNFITMRLESLWKQEYPEQDRGFIHTCEWEELTVPIDQLTAGKPADMKKAQYYLKLLWAGKVDFPPLVSVNGVVIDGLHRFWAYQQMGYQTVTVYQNKPWAMPTAA